MKQTAVNRKLIATTVVETLRELDGFGRGVPEELVNGCRQRFLQREQAKGRTRLTDSPLEIVDEFMDLLREAGLVSLFPIYDEVEFTYRVVQELSLKGLICIDCTDAELRWAIEGNVAHAAACREEKVRQTNESLERLVQQGTVEITVVDEVRRYRLVDGAAL